MKNFKRMFSTPQLKKRKRKKKDTLPQNEISGLTSRHRGRSD